MIGYLKGKILEVTNDSALIDVQGVGYEIHASLNTLADLQERMGRGEVVVWIHTHVREDALQMFGFARRDEKNLFLSLLKVNGVGPKMAMSLLSGAQTEQIHEMIEAGDAKALAKLPKVGKKTAEQIILTLQGKLVRVEAPKIVKTKVQDEIQSALIHLGFKPQVVEQFVATLPKDIETEEGVRRGLGALSNAF